MALDYTKKYTNKIAIVGKFNLIHDEEYIAQSFEDLGCTVRRISQSLDWNDIANALVAFKPDLLLFSKWNWHPNLDKILQKLRREDTKIASWVFDLYFGYHREYQVRNAKFFNGVDMVFSTDGGHNGEWARYGIKHTLLRQGIYHKECFIVPEEEKEHDVIFIGSDNPVFPERKELMELISYKYKNFKWYGKKDTCEVRSTDLNDLFAKTKVVIGDSYPSQNYWSNRVVETLGRGGFLIHRDVAGIKKEYPDLVTYNGTPQDLLKKIDYYLCNDSQRKKIIKKNFDIVKNNYTSIHRCEEILKWLNQ